MKTSRDARGVCSELPISFDRLRVVDYGYPFSIKVIKGIKVIKPSSSGRHWVYTGPIFIRGHRHGTFADGCRNTFVARCPWCAATSRTHRRQDPGRAARTSTRYHLSARHIHRGLPAGACPPPGAPPPRFFFPRHPFRTSNWSTVRVLRLSQA